MRGKKHERYLKEQIKAVGNPLPEMKLVFKKELDLLKEYCKNKKVLDVGCGIGRPAYKLSKYCKEIVCIDNNEHVIGIAKKNLSNIKNIKILLRDALNTQFEDEEFDVCYATYNLIGSIDSKRELVKEMSRITKSNGYVIILTWKKDVKTTNFLSKYYRHLGFEIKDINEERTVTDKWTFERLSPNLIENLFKENNLEEIKIKNVGLAWCAIIGKKK